MVAHAILISTWEAEAGGCLWVQGESPLEIEFQYSGDYTDKLHWKTVKNKEKNKKNKNHNKTLEESLSSL